jgi:hypothetical protein
MPRDGAITFGDLIGKVDCCGSSAGPLGPYHVAKLVEQGGRRARAVRVVGRADGGLPSQARWRCERPGAACDARICRRCCERQARVGGDATPAGPILLALG